MGRTPSPIDIAGIAAGVAMVSILLAVRGAMHAIRWARFRAA